MPFADTESCATFTLKGSDIAPRMAAFVTSFGRAASGETTFLQSSTTIYHLDVVVSRQSKASSFVLSTSQIERVSSTSMYRLLHSLTVVL
jgi:hypothetical protein